MYHDPKNLLSPKEMVKSKEVIDDAGPVESSWSVARLNWSDIAADQAREMEAEEWVEALVGDID